MVSSRTSPPHNLQLVIDFVNTLDVEAGVDRTRTPAELSEWLQGQGLRSPGERELDAAEHGRAIELREALREVMRGHTHRDEPTQAGRRLDEVSRLGQLSVRFAAAGTVELAPRAGGEPGVLAGLLVPVAYAALDGTWRRVKACDADDCQWAFYDSSRNHSGRWCDMAVCGNRTKVRAYRAKRTD
ncbi:MAG TPA: CGNR zinc finger domain-containing protein [Solirubrobacteraceae bacterium]